MLILPMSLFIYFTLLLPVNLNIDIIPSYCLLFVMGFDITVDGFGRRHVYSDRCCGRAFPATTACALFVCWWTGRDVPIWPRCLTHAWILRRLVDVIFLILVYVMFYIL